MQRTKKRARSERRAAMRAARVGARSGHDVLAVLTTSALALIPGLAERAAAQSASDGWSFEYGYSMYAEDDIAAGKVSAGSRKRYDIDTHQFELHAPIGKRFSLGLDVAYEKMSGATPWFIEPDLAGDPVVVMTGASIKDARTDALGTLSFEGEAARTSLSGGISIEDDYTSLNAGLGQEWDFNEKATTFSWGAGFATDESDPNPTSFQPDPNKHHKKSGTFSLGVAQVIDRASVVQSSLSIQYVDGFLADPYKLVSSGGNAFADRRPGTRTQLSWLTRYRRHFEKAHGSLHADYQLYWDTWAVTAHTLELGWHQELFERVTVTPSVRYYTQREAEFYAPFFAPGLSTDQNATSDFRLSPYGAVSFKLRADLRLGDLLKGVNARLGVQWETYLSGKEFAIGRVAVENPALVDFSALMITLKTDF